MSLLFDPAVPARPPLADVLLEAALKGVVVLGLAGLIVLAMRRAGAAARHGVWCLALAGLVALPALCLALPGWPVLVKLPRQAARPVAAEPLAGLPALAELYPSAPAPAPGPADDEAPAVRPATQQGAAEPAAAAEARRSAVPIRTWLLLAWAAGAVLAAVPLLAGPWVLRRLRRSARPVTGGPAFDLLRQLTGEMGLRRTVALLQGDARVMPMTWGLWRPTVLLPTGAEAWPQERLHVVLLHELAHVRRWDCLTQLVAHVARALYWFNPLAWVAVACLRVEQERACDDAVLNAGTRATDYAQHLLAVTAGVPSRWLVSPVALAVGTARRIERRLRLILDVGRPRNPLRGRAVVPAVAVSLALFLPLAACRLQLSGRAEGAAVRVAAPAAPDAQRTDEVQTQLKDHYVRKLDDRTLDADAIKGMLSALHDPYTTYFSPEELAALQRDVAGTFAGIGAQLALRDGMLTVVTPLEDSPAFKAGIRPGDVIEEIDGAATKGMALAEAVKRIIGKVNTVVKLKVRHAGGELAELAITRGQVRVRSVAGFRRDRAGHWQFLLAAEHGIGYLQITHFSEGTLKDVRAVTDPLQKQNLKGLILDLRSCPGGLLPGGLDVARLFLARGKIVTIKGEHAAEQTYQAEGPAPLADLPLVVLINGSTASAAEILAGALRDNDRAVLVGSRSFGKGSVQQIVPLKDKGALKLTTAYFYLPSGRNIQRHPGAKDWGVDPTDGDYVPMDAKQLAKMQQLSQERSLLGKKADQAAGEKLTPERIAKDYADPQLAAALKAMQAKLHDGRFGKVGKPNADMAADIQREEVRERREGLMRDLNRIRKELADLEKQTGGAEKRPPGEDK
jgi:carboxyl-terminal processing protease